MSRPSFSLTGRAMVLGLVVVFGWIIGRPVYADPHAVFYTATGQQQLFFNVLAALNQADYVEPAQPQTGTPAGESGQEALDRRAAAGFPPESDPQILATNTNLSAVITRNITLEGSDVWTAYIAIQHAVDVVRSQTTAELIQKYCERGQGLKGCQNTVSARKNQDEAFVTDPEQQAEEPVERGSLAVYLSGSAEAEKIINQAVTDNLGPVAYDQDVADLRQNTKDDTNKFDWFKLITGLAARTFFGPIVDANLLQFISFGGDGTVSIDNSAPFSPDNVNSDTFADDYISQLAKVGSLPSDLLDKGLSATLAIKSFYDSPAVIGSGGGKGDLETARDGTTGQVVSKVTVPAGVKDKLAQEPIDQIAQLDLNRNYVPAAQSTNPDGNQQFTTDPAANGNAAPVAAAGTGLAGQVAGITSDQASGSTLTGTQPGGRVAGTSTTDGDTNPEAQPEAFQDEPVPVDYLTAIGVYDPNTGCGCSLHNAVNDFGSVIIKRINQ